MSAEDFTPVPTVTTSEIVDRLAQPRSTVSEAINRLYEKNRIEKVRKGRENLIRLV